MLELTRPFPFSVRPLHRETVESYSRRTLNANFSSPHHQQHMTGLATSSQKNGDRAEAWSRVLTAKTGRELRLAPDPAGWLHHADSTSCEFCAELLPVRHMCTLCAAGDEVEQNPHFDGIVCVRHHRWVGVTSTLFEQQTVGDPEIAAELWFRKLRRSNRIDVRLYMLLLGAFSGAAEVAAFASIVAVVRALTSAEFLRRFFRVAVPFREAHLLLATTVEEAIETTNGELKDGEETDSLTRRLVRALWLYLRPMMWAVHHAALTGRFGPVQPAWAHDFPSGTWRHVEVHTADRAEPFSGYLEVTGDTALTAAQFGLTFTNERRLPPVPGDPTRLVLAICDHGHQFPATRVKPFAPASTKSPRCPICHGNRFLPGYNDLLTMRPDIACEFDEARNGGLTAADISPGNSDVEYFWLCPPKQHSYPATASNRTSANSKCPVCLNRLIQSGINDLATTHPEVVSEIHPSWLAKGVATSEGAGSRAIIDWACADGHTYTMAICDRVKRAGCPQCLTGLKHQGDYRLAQSHPGLSRQWHPSLNGKLTPADFSAGSNHEAFWVCMHGHPPFNQRIDRRTGDDYKCPLCSNRRVASGINDMGTTAPLMATEFQSDQNAPTDISRAFAGTKPYWWKCIAHGHILRQSGAHRLLSRGCPKCPADERVLSGLEGA